MPGSTSVTSSAISTLGALAASLDDLASGKGDAASLQKLLGGANGSLDASSLTSGLLGPQGQGSSFLDPTYWMVSGTLQLFATGLLVYAKKAGELKPMLRSFALFTLSYDYKLPAVWLVAALFWGASLFVE